MGKTAVIIIHGVGEQAPMSTVRGFVRFFAGKYFRSKPNNLGEFFELRRLTTFGKHEAAYQDALKDFDWYPANTVFLEYYWAFHFRDTRPALVTAWSARTLSRLIFGGYFTKLRPPIQLMAIAWVIVLALVVLALLAGAHGLYELIHGQASVRGTGQMLVGVLAPLALKFIRPVFLGWVGDAARYFGNSPDTPVERQAIRLEGMELLKALHDYKEQGEQVYDRIVVVGHSLGSVIAYDILTHYWASVNDKILVDKNAGELHAIESEGLSPSCSPVPYMAAQDGIYRLVHAVSPGGVPTPESQLWRVTDLVTLGSPLTHAPFLMAQNRDDLRERQRQREIPTCPPVPDDHKDARGIASFFYQYTPVTGTDHVAGHTAAPFAFTKWTNLYFNADPIGGALAPYFGKGIEDIKLAPHPSVGYRGAKRQLQVGVGQRFLNLLGGSHVRYWQLLGDDPTLPVSGVCADKLRDIVK